MVFARVLRFRCPSPEERAQGKPGAHCARSLVRKTKKAHEQIHHRFSQSRRLSPRNGLTVSFVLSPVSGLYCHRCQTRTGGPDRRQGRGARTTRLRRPPRAFRLVKDHLTPAAAIATRTPFRDDREASLMVARARRSNATDLPGGASENFYFHEFVKPEFVTRMLRQRPAKPSRSKIPPTFGPTGRLMAESRCRGSSTRRRRRHVA
jgi:hypothetical protein